MDDLENFKSDDYREAAKWTANIKSDLFEKDSSFLNCLKPLLDSLRWRRSIRSVIESLPYKAKALDRHGLLRVMNLLNFEEKQVAVLLGDLDQRLIPSLFIRYDEEAFVILGVNKREMTLFDGVENQVRKILLNELRSEQWRGTIFVFTEVPRLDASQTGKFKWFSAILSKYKKLFWGILAISFVLNLLALAVPLFIKSVYDSVIADDSFRMLLEFSLGVLIALAATAALEYLRSKVLAYIGAQLDAKVGTAMMEQIFYLPAGFIENASISSQLSRIKDFNNLRDFFSGPFILLMFEFPFSLIFLFVIWLVGGLLVLVPIVAVFVFLLAGYFSRMYVKKYSSYSATRHDQQQKMLIEILTNVVDIKFFHSETIWFERYKKILADSTLADYRLNLIMANISSFTDAAMILAALAVLGFGVLMVLKGTFTIGGMILVMILLWRILGPLKSIYAMMAQIDQVRSSIEQLNALMRLPPEHVSRSITTQALHFQGYVTLENVSFRYTQQSDPVLSGINLKIQPGAIVAITGDSISGKSTLLKIILGLYRPQMGVVQLDGQDIRQLDPVEVRQQIAYVPDKMDFFYDSIEQNLLLAKPDATAEHIEEVLKMVGVYEDIMDLPDRLETIMLKNSTATLPREMLQKISLARALLKGANLLMVDDILEELDIASQKVIMQSLKKVAEKRSVILVARQPEILSEVDRIVVMKAGRIVMDGPRAKVLPDLLF